MPPENQTNIYKDTMNTLKTVKSFYMTFDGRRCYCNVRQLMVNNTRMVMEIEYLENDNESYDLSSDDGFIYKGKYISNEDGSSIEFKRFKHGKDVLFYGKWKCGGREGEWFIEAINGIKKEGKTDFFTDAA